MCFAIPGLVTDVKKDTVRVSYGNEEKDVITQSGYVIKKVGAREALRIFEAMK